MVFGYWVLITLILIICRCKQQTLLSLTNRATHHLWKIPWPSNRG